MMDCYNSGHYGYQVVTCPYPDMHEVIGTLNTVLKLEIRHTGRFIG